MRLLAVAMVSFALWAAIGFGAKTVWLAVKSDGRPVLASSQGGGEKRWQERTPGMDHLELRKEAAIYRVRASQPGLSEAERQRLLRSAEQLEGRSRELARHVTDAETAAR